VSRLFNKVMNELKAAEDTIVGSPAKEETLELLNVEDEKPEILDIPETVKKEDDDEEEKESEPEGEEDELKEIEEELEGPKEEDLELTTPVRRKEILAKYPKLFKDFPYLEKAYYREQQFTELLPTIQDAKQAVEKAGILDQVEQEILNGDIGVVLRATKNQDPEAFLKIADNYLPALKAVDQQAYYHVLGNVVKDTIITMVREARNLGEQGAPLQAAANILNQFVFGSQKFSAPSKLSKNSDPQDQNREQEFQQREQQVVMQQFESTKDDLQTRADNVLKSTIDAHIDPKNSMTDYVKKNATREAFSTLEDLIARDTRFRSILDKLWEKAFEKRFDKESTDKIKSAYLSKAKTLLPSVIKKARNDALKGMGRKVVDTDETEELADKKGPITPGKSTSPSSGKFKSAKDIPREMSTLDVLMKD
jgi:hypothetical protein